MWCTQHGMQHSWPGSPTPAHGSPPPPAAEGVNPAPQRLRGDTWKAGTAARSTSSRASSTFARSSSASAARTRTRALSIPSTIGRAVPTPHAALVKLGMQLWGVGRIQLTLQRLVGGERRARTGEETPERSLRAAGGPAAQRDAPSDANVHKHTLMGGPPHSASTCLTTAASPHWCAPCPPCCSPLCTVTP
jgi:hypothetical protein